MTPERHVIPPPQSQSRTYPAGEPVAPAPLSGEAGPASVFQEINERRARIENTELLRHLRGL